MRVMQCLHEEVRCLNEFDIIRKYRCKVCGDIMMCACEEAFGVKLLSHQLGEVICSRTCDRLPVTLGFQKDICRECRGLPCESHPAAETYGRTGKLQRYYWRELLKREMELCAAWAEEQGEDPFLVRYNRNDMQKDAEQQALSEIKELNATTPKYIFDKDESQSQVLAECEVEIVNVRATHVKSVERKRVSLLWNGKPVGVEEYAQLHYRELGYESLATESVPFHVLFGVYLWPLVLDPEDELGQLSFFGDRNAIEDKRAGRNIALVKPEDFGSAAYGLRRVAAIDQHFAEVLVGDDLAEMFNT